jgi:polysaccharide deacetylase family protein (PEP-CTERM system associated)
VNDDARFLASFDVEDWFHAENAKPWLPTTDWTRLESRVERNTHRLLDILADMNVTSTFFVLGWIARTYPRLVRRMVEEGHEVASHTDAHRLLYGLSRSELVRDLASARDALEQVVQRPVLGIRAPAFSIDDRVLEGIAEAGYWYDSSVYSFRAHDRYGSVSTAIDPRAGVVEIRPGLLELPVSTLVIGRIVLPWAGGGYFRIVPYPLFRRGVTRRLSTSSWFLFYFHPWELDDREVAPGGMPRHVRFRAYVGRSRMARDLRRLLAEFGSERIDRALRSLGYEIPA